MAGRVRHRPVSPAVAPVTPPALPPPTAATAEPLSVPVAIRWLFAADLAMGALAVLNYVVAEALGVQRSDFLRSGLEANLPSWYATVQLAAVSAVLLPLAVRDASWRRPATWGVALGPALFALLSLDEGAMVHERVGAWLSAVAFETPSLGDAGPWLLVLAPAYGAVALVAVRAWARYLRDRPRTLALLVAGVVLLGASAAGLEALMFLLDAEHTLLGKALSVVEETGEMVAVTLLLWGSVRLVRAEGVRVELGAARPGAG